MKRLLKLAFFSTLLTLLTYDAYGEIKYNNIRFQQFDSSLKLPHSVVYDITQDDRGYMWFGTRGGLCRYDGYTITQFQHDDNDPRSLRNNFIRKLYNNSQNNKLWIVTDEGLCCFDYTTELFTSYDIDKNSRTYNIYITSTKEGELLAAFSNGIFKYDNEKDEFIPYLLTSVSKPNRIICDNDDRLWIKTAEALLCYDIQHGEHIKLPNTIAKYRDSAKALTYTESNHIIFKSDKYLYLYNIDKEQTLNISQSANITECKCAISDKENNIWIGAENGISVIDSSSGELIIRYKRSYDDLSALNDSPTHSLFCDNRGNIWAGTFFGGVNYYIYGSDQFHTYPYGSGKNHLSGRAVRQIINDNKGGLYVATEDGGLNHIDANNNVTRSDVLNPRIGSDIMNVHSLYLHGDNLWVGLFRGGVIKFNTRTNQSINYADSISTSSGFDIISDSDNNILYGSINGLFYINNERLNSNATKISQINTHNMCQVNDSTILLATRRNGVSRVNTKTKEIMPSNILPKPNTYVTYIFKDSKERIWIGTEGEGLYVTDQSDKIINIYDQHQLSSNSIKSIIEDHDGYIWVGTGNGLCCIDPESKSVKKYNTTNGLPTDQFNYSSACIKPNGDLYFGTINGMISFTPRELQTFEPTFNVTTTGIWVNSDKLTLNATTGNTSKSESTSAPNLITLTYDQAKSIRIEYSGLNYQYGKNTLYSMMMEGVDSEWQSVAQQHQVRYSNLNAGDYRLKIRASNDGVNWDSDGQLNLNIKVLPPWWQTNVAYIIYILIIATAIYLIIRYAKTRLSLKMELESANKQRRNIEELNRQKINFFTYISHDLKTPLTLVTSPLKQIIEKHHICDGSDINKLKRIYRNANRMQYLIDELLSFSKIEMGQMKINIRKGNIMLFLQEISAMFNSVADDKDIEFITSINDTDEEVWFSPSKLERIVYNLLSNAFKYTPQGGVVKIRAQIIKINEESFVEISIKDNGRGIPKDIQDKIFESYYQVDKRDHREGFGLGLALTKSLIEIHKGDIKVISEVNKGAEFIVTLNVSKSAYTQTQLSDENITSQDVEKYNQRIKDTLELIPNSSHTLQLESESSEREVILIIEDNVDMNNYISEIFSDKYDVMQAYNGKEGFKLMERQLPSIIICDIMMPKMTGLEFTHRLQEDVNICHIPVILLTAKTDIKDQEVGYTAGAVAYVTKPFDAHSLELQVSNIQRNRSNNIDRFKRSEDVNVNLIATNSKDSKFMNDLIDIIQANISNETFSVNEVTEKLHISRSRLHTKLKSLSGYSYTQFVRSIKMKEAKKLLTSGMSISSTSYSLGIPDPNYFTKCFKKEFNITPTEFLKE